MATLKYKQIKKDNDLFTLQRFYKNKYFALFMNAYKFDGVDDQQARYILKKFWQDGKILAFKIDGTENEENPNGLICFTGFTYSGLNIYDYPTDVLAINTRGASFIPATPMQNMVNCVVGYDCVAYCLVCGVFHNQFNFGKKEKRQWTKLVN